MLSNQERKTDPKKLEKDRKYVYVQENAVNPQFKTVQA